MISACNFGLLLLQSLDIELSPSSSFNHERLYLTNGHEVDSHLQQVEHTYFSPLRWLCCQNNKSGVLAVLPRLFRRLHQFRFRLIGGFSANDQEASCEAWAWATEGSYDQRYEQFPCITFSSRSKCSSSWYFDLRACWEDQHENRMPSAKIKEQINAGRIRRTIRSTEFEDKKMSPCLKA